MFAYVGLFLTERFVFYSFCCIPFLPFAECRCAEIVSVPCRARIETCRQRISTLTATIRRVDPYYVLPTSEYTLLGVSYADIAAGRSKSQERRSASPAYEKPEIITTTKLERASETLVPETQKTQAAVQPESLPVTLEPPSKRTELAVPEHPAKRKPPRRSRSPRRKDDNKPAVVKEALVPQEIHTERISTDVYVREREEHVDFNTNKPDERSPSPKASPPRHLTVQKIRGRSPSPIWGPGQTSYAEILRGQFRSSEERDTASPKIEALAKKLIQAQPVISETNTVIEDRPQIIETTSHVPNTPEFIQSKPQITETVASYRQGESHTYDNKHQQIHQTPQPSYQSAPTQIDFRGSLQHPQEQYVVSSHAQGWNQYSQTSYGFQPNPFGTIPSEMPQNYYPQNIPQQPVQSNILDYIQPIPDMVNFIASGQQLMSSGLGTYHSSPQFSDVYPEQSLYNVPQYLGDQYGRHQSASKDDNRFVPTSETNIETVVTSSCEPSVPVERPEEKETTPEPKELRQDIATSDDAGGSHFSYAQILSQGLSSKPLQPSSLATVQNSNARQAPRQKSPTPGHISMQTEDTRSQSKEQQTRKIKKDTPTQEKILNVASRQHKKKNTKREKRPVLAENEFVQTPSYHGEPIESIIGGNEATELKQDLKPLSDVEDISPITDKKREKT
ncbi:hypothetical protein NQ318_000614 [Aromia moschata]|uniref:Uncharacterized protein n=1 Tax=Aromia moschata TaxID=1265417 RepID=A0AAV8XQL6_9CUCU|nr:hypothetical protein NQ318_000614 [Aromia moschata]